MPLTDAIRRPLILGITGGLLCGLLSWVKFLGAFQGENRGLGLAKLLWMLSFEHLASFGVLSAILGIIAALWRWRKRPLYTYVRRPAEAML